MRRQRTVAHLGHSGVTHELGPLVRVARSVRGRERSIGCVTEPASASTRAPSRSAGSRPSPFAAGLLVAALLISCKTSGRRVTIPAASNTLAGVRDLTRGGEASRTSTRKEVAPNDVLETRRQQAARGRCQTSSG
mgnify:CR=1 FL=1